MSQQTTPPTRRRSGLGLGVLLLVLLSFYQIASASQVSIAGAKAPYAASFGGCSTNTLTVTNTTTGTTATQATISGLDATNCAGKTLQLWLGSTGTTMFTATIDTVDAATVTVTLPSYTTTAITDAIVYVGGWAANTVWTYTPVVIPLLSCVVTNDATKNCTATVIGGSNGTNWVRQIRVTTTSTGNVTWRVTMNLSDSSLPFLAKRVNDDQNRLTKVSSSGCTVTPLMLVVRGSTGYNRVTPAVPVDYQITGRSTSGSGSNELLNC